MTKKSFPLYDREYRNHCNNHIVAFTASDLNLRDDLTRNKTLEIAPTVKIRPGLDAYDMHKIIANNSGANNPFKQDEIKCRMILRVTCVYNNRFTSIDNVGAVHREGVAW